MALKIAFMMDPIGPINIDADSTFRLAEEAQARGHELFYYTPDNMYYREGHVFARMSSLTVRRVKGDHFDLGEEKEVNLA
ncbi:MAG: glutathione synthase, partial [Pseudomonadota bacterium]|nr:glutathione synthase [Pseudomonadota bacterium]